MHESEIQIKERPILFSPSMVRAILDGEKTQTRRPVKPQPIPAQDLCVEECACDTCLSDDPTQYFIQNDKVRMASHFGSYPVDCPYGKPGDRLWVRETWDAMIIPNEEIFDPECHRARNPKDGRLYHVWWRCGNEFEFCPDTRWRSPILMPRWASRLTLEITDVRVERLLSISQEDVWAEGFRWHPDLMNAWDEMHKRKEGLRWEDDPWVWVVEFRRVGDD